MVPLDNINLLKQVSKQLKDQQDFYLHEIKTKYKDFYDWSTESNIDLKDLRNYSASISAAVIIAISTTTPITNVEEPKLVPQVVVINRGELQGLSEDEKGELVWERYGHIIDRVAIKYDLDPKLIFATIMIESGGDTHAIRQEPQIGDASYGLGQILYGTARGIGFEGTPEKLYDPEANIELIGRYHKRNQVAYGGNLTPQQLTTAYNTGNPYSFALPGHLDKFQRWYDKAGNFIG